MLLAGIKQGVPLDKKPFRHLTSALYWLPNQIILTFGSHPTSSQPPTESYSVGCGSDLKQKILNSILGVPYNKHLPPPPGDTPLAVNVSATIINIVSVDELYNLWKLNLYVRQEWADDRLRYQSLLRNCPKFRYLQLTTDEMTDSFWKPNLFFPDEVDGKVFDQSNRAIRIFPNGHVFYSVRASVTLYCSGLGSRPGEYLCSLQMFPYGPEEDSIVLRWAPIDPVQINRTTIILPNHVVRDIDTSAPNIETVSGNFSTVLANFHFQRKACLA